MSIIKTLRQAIYTMESKDIDTEKIRYFVLTREGNSSLVYYAAAAIKSPYELVVMSSNIASIDPINHRYNSLIGEVGMIIDLNKIFSDEDLDGGARELTLERFISDLSRGGFLYDINKHEIIKKS